MIIIIVVIIMGKIPSAGVPRIFDWKWNKFIVYFNPFQYLWKPWELYNVKYDIHSMAIYIYLHMKVRITSYIRYTLSSKEWNPSFSSKEWIHAFSSEVCNHYLRVHIMITFLKSEFHFYRRVASIKFSSKI